MHSYAHADGGQDEVTRQRIELRGAAIGRLAACYAPLQISEDLEEFSVGTFGDPEAVLEYIAGRYDQADIYKTAQHASGLGAEEFLVFRLPGDRGLLACGIEIAGAEYDFLLAEFGEGADESPTDLGQFAEEQLAKAERVRKREAVAVVGGFIGLQLVAWRAARSVRKRLSRS